MERVRTPRPRTARAFGTRAAALASGIGALAGWGVLLPAAGQMAREPSRAGDLVQEEVVSVSFTGNQAFTDAELRRAIATRASSCPFVLAVTTCAVGLDWGRDRAYYSPRLVEEDVGRLRVLLYPANGFRSATVQPRVSRVEGGVAVEFVIDEGEAFRIGSVNFAGDPLPAGLGIDQDLPVAPGDPLGDLSVKEARDTVQMRLRNAGYAWAEVFRRHLRPPGADTATLTYQIELGPLASVGPVRVVGHQLLGAEAILDRLPFREGDRFSERLIQEAQRSLHELEIVARASVRRDAAEAGADSALPVVVEVREGDAHRVRLGGGLNSAECINFEGRWASRNFFGGGRTLQLRGRVSNLLAALLQPTFLCAHAGTEEFGRLNGLVALDFAEPTFLSPRTSLLAGVFVERQSQKNVFVRDALGMELGLNRAAGRNARFSLRVRPEISRLDAAEVTLCATFLACAPAEIEALASNHWLSPVALSFSRDGTDGLLSPRRGFRALVDLEYAGRLTGSDYAYFRALADGSLYREIDRATVLALRLRAGAISSGTFVQPVARSGGPLDVVPSQKRFYGGGAGSVRGFAQGTLGPRSLSIGVEELLRRRASQSPACEPRAVRELTCDGSSLVGAGLFQLRPIGGLGTLEASAELRFDFSGGLFGGAAFVDVGQVWPQGISLDDLEVSPGVGVRYNTVFGPIRLDLAYSFRDQEPLPVVTSQIRPFVPGRDDPSVRIDAGPPGTREPIDWVVSEDLALLRPPVLFGDDPGFSFRRFQLHFSVGQAF